MVFMDVQFKALSHPARRRIVGMLRAGPMTSGDIAAAFEMSWPTVTGHLNALKEAALVSAERDGNSIRYRLEISALEEALSFLMSITGVNEKAETESDATKISS